MAKVRRPKNKPLHNGSGGGTGNNAGRGGCKNPKKTRQGANDGRS